MTGLDALENIKHGIYYDGEAYSLIKDAFDVSLDVIEKELKAFHILFKAFLNEPMRDIILNSSYEDFKETYRTKGEEVKYLFTEEEYIYVLTVLKEVLYNDRT